MLKLSLPENLYFGTKTDYVVEAIRTAILVEISCRGHGLRSTRSETFLK
jgi:hypothetical protein